MSYSRLDLEPLLKQDFLLDELEEENLIPTSKIYKYFTTIAEIYLQSNPSIPFEEFFHLIINKLYKIQHHS